MVARFPLASQVASQLLTLQLAIAHTDMPLDSGPTQLLPYSQQFEHGYLAYHDPQFAQVFKEKMIQVELEAGDAVFFSPALFHSAGDNRTVDFERSANLLQVSACWSKPMESVDRDAILRNTWPYIIRHVSSETDGVAASSSQALLKAICDGYSFPTNLDKDPPSDAGVSTTIQVVWTMWVDKDRSIAPRPNWRWRSKQRRAGCLETDWRNSLRPTRRRGELSLVESPRAVGDGGCSAAGGGSHPSSQSGESPCCILIMHLNHAPSKTCPSVLRVEHARLETLPAAEKCTVTIRASMCET